MADSNQINKKIDQNSFPFTREHLIRTTTPNAGYYMKHAKHSHRRPIWEQTEGDDIFVRTDQPYEIDEFQYKPLKKKIIFKPHNYLKPGISKRKATSICGYSDSDSKFKSEPKTCDEQLEDLLKKLNLTKDDFDPQPQSGQPNLLDSPFTVADGFKCYRQRASTSYAAQFKPPPPDNELTLSFKPAFLTRDFKADLPFDFSTFKRIGFAPPNYASPNKLGIFPFVYGPPLPDVKVFQSEYQLRFKNHFPLSACTQTRKVIPEPTPKILEYLT